MRSGRSSEALFADMPEGVSTPELRVRLPEASHKTFMQKLRDSADFPGAQIIDTDGVRVEFRDGWGLVRASNTSPVLTLRFEADSKAALEGVQQRFRRLLQATADTALPLPF